MAPVKLIMDTDPGVDDVLALFLLLASPEIQLEAITITFGNTTLPKAYDNIKKVYQVIQKHLDAHSEDARRFPNFKSKHRPIYAKGAEKPIQGELNLAQYFHGPDGLSNISSTHPVYNVDPSIWTEDNPYLEISGKPSHEVILDVLKREPAGTVTILSCGPLTNISLAISKDPHTFSKVARLITMGAAVDVPGNTSATAEFNVFADPWAAQHVLDASCSTPPLFDFVLVPLDITCHHYIDFDRILPEGFKSSEDHVEQFISTILRRPRIVLNQLGLPDYFEMIDPLAAWYTIRTSGPDPQQGWGTVKRKFVVERTGEHTKGMCVVDRRGTKEEAGATRAIEGIVIDTKETTDSSHGGEHGGINVLLKWPDTKVFVDEMMRRVFWYCEPKV